MQEVYEVFESFGKIIGCVTKKAYRNCAVLMTGAAVIALISFNSKEFGGCGKNKTALSEKHNSGIMIKEEEAGEIKPELQTEETVSVSARDTDVFVRASGQTRKQETKNTIQETTPKEPSVSAESITDKKETDLQSRETVGQESLEENIKTETTKAPFMEEQVPKVQSSSGRVIFLNDRDYQILLRIVEAEAGGEGLTGKKLVANVILNRVNHRKFPNTVEAVVFERSGGHVQFSPTADGRFESVTITEETIQAVEMVLCGENNSQGALFFSARSKADPDNMSWFDRNLRWLFAHGGHEFYTLP